MAAEKPLAIDLFCGLGGWTEGLLAEGYRVIGFDNERHDYGDGRRYPAQLVLQDVLTIHGRQFQNAALIVASPPCTEYSYMAMPWSLARAKAEKIRASEAERARLNALFNACWRIKREASAAAGRDIPLVIENVRGAQEWVGRAVYHFGSFYLWGDVPALMPTTRAKAKIVENHVNQRNGHRSTRHLTNPAEHGYKQPGIAGTRANGKGDRWFQDGAARHGSKSIARKRASALLAKIPLTLSTHIAKVYK